MKRLLQVLGIFSLPIWAKMLLGFFLAVTLPVIFIGVVILNGVHQAGVSNAEQYVVETGGRQANAIEQAFKSAENGLNEFIQNTVYYRRLVNLLPMDTTPFLGVGGTIPVDPIEKVNVIGDLQDALLNPSNGLYTQIELLNSDGLLVLRATPGRGREITWSEDRSETEAYQAGHAAQLVGRSQTISVIEQSGEPVIEVINVIWRNRQDLTGMRTVAGYLVTRLEPARVIYDNLIEPGEFLAMNNLVVARNGDIILGIDGRVTDADVAVDVNRIQTVSGAGFAQSFIVDDPVLNEEVVQYYHPIQDTPFMFVSSGQIELIAQRLLDALFAPGLVLFIGAPMLILVLALLFTQFITPPLNRLRHAMVGMVQGDFESPLEDARRGDEIGDLVDTFADVRKQTQNLVQALEARIDDRIRDVKATRDIGHMVATQRDTEKLMRDVVDLLVERFENIYHAQIFLLNTDRSFAVLRSSTGEPGKILLGRGHKLAVGSTSVIGRVTQRGETVIARDTSSSRVHHYNEVLPDTRAEMAIPLKVDGQVIGALDVQSKQSDAFDADQIGILETVSEKIVLALENARLYQESIRRLDEIERQRRAATAQAWREYLRGQRRHELQSEAGMRPAAEVNMTELRQEALRKGEVVIGKKTARNTVPIAVPLRLRNQVLGAVEWELPGENVNQNLILLAQDLVGHLAVNLDNARLFEESEQSAVRERLVNEIAGKISNQSDIDQILQTAVREVGQALQTQHVTIRLHNQGSNGHSAADEAPSNGNGSGKVNGNGSQQAESPNGR